MGGGMAARGRRKWGSTAAVLALPVLVLTWLVVAVVRFTTEHTVPPGIDADAVMIDVTYEGPEQALVRFTAFTV